MKTDGLEYTAGDIVSGLLEANKRIVGTDKQAACSARLGRDLVNVIDKWMSDEAKRDSDDPTMIIASMHGVMTIVGTIAVNHPEKVRRQEFIDGCRLHINKLYDVMAESVEEVMVEK